jgi:hypothetical protein
MATTGKWPVNAIFNLKPRLQSPLHLTLYRATDIQSNHTMCENRMPLYVPVTSSQISQGHINPDTYWTEAIYSQYRWNNIKYYCNIGREVQVTGKTTKRISVDYAITFLWPPFYRCSMRTRREARQIWYLNSILVHTLLSKSMASVANSPLILPASFVQIVPSSSIFVVLAKENFKESKVRRTRWPNPFLW